MTAKIKRLSEGLLEPKTTRTSVSFPHELYETVERIAKDKKVSVAWIVRDATEKYVNEQWPLLSVTSKEKS